eukprot:854258-Pelagomonas_calceolata.AAC.1
MVAPLKNHQKTDEQVSILSPRSTNICVSAHQKGMSIILNLLNSWFGDRSSARHCFQTWPKCAHLIKQTALLQAMSPTNELKTCKKIDMVLRIHSNGYNVTTGGLTFGWVFWLIGLGLVSASQKEIPKLGHKKEKCFVLLMKELRNDLRTHLMQQICCI